MARLAMLASFAEGQVGNLLATHRAGARWLLEPAVPTLHARRW